MKTSPPQDNVPAPAEPSAVSPAVAKPTSQTSLSPEQFVELEGGVIDLMCKMEHHLSVVRESDPADRNEVMVEASQNMLSVMADFSEAFLSGEGLEKTNQEISTAFMSSQVLKELTQSASIGGLLRRTFGGADPNQAAIDDNANELIRGLKRTLVTVLFHTIQLAGFDSPMGQQFDQSTCVFVAELESFRIE